MHTVIAAFSADPMQPAPVPPPPTPPPPLLPSSRRRDVDVLSSSSMGSTAWRREGQPRWWVGKLDDYDDITFMRIPWVEGRKQFNKTLSLLPGRYVLGVGKGMSAIREPFTVE